MRWYGTKDAPYPVTLILLKGQIEQGGGDCWDAAMNCPATIKDKEVHIEVITVHILQKGSMLYSTF